MASPGAPGAGIGLVAACADLGSVVAPSGLTGGSGRNCLRKSTATAGPVASLFATTTCDGALSREYFVSEFGFYALLDPKGFLHCRGPGVGRLI